MTKKRRNGGHKVRNCGHITRLRCDSCGSSVPKDKAVIKDIKRSIISSSIITDIKNASVYENYNIPKTYIKTIYCISCAVHRKLV